MKNIYIGIFVLIVLLLSGCKDDFKGLDNLDRCVYDDKCTDLEILSVNDSDTSLKIFLKDSLDKDIDEISIVYSQIYNNGKIKFEVYTSESFSEQGYYYYETLHTDLRTYTQDYYSDINIRIELEINYNNIVLLFEDDVDVNIIIDSENGLINDLTPNNEIIFNLYEESNRNTVVKVNFINDGSMQGYVTYRVVDYCLEIYSGNYGDYNIIVKDEIKDYFNLHYSQYSLCFMSNFSYRFD